MLKEIRRCFYSLLCIALHYSDLCSMTQTKHTPVYSFLNSGVVEMSLLLLDRSQAVFSGSDWYTVTTSTTLHQSKNKPEMAYSVTQMTEALATVRIRAHEGS